jgi:hypothetical protein
MVWFRWACSRTCTRQYQQRRGPGRDPRTGSRPFEIYALTALFGVCAGEYAVYFVVVPALGTAALTGVSPCVVYERVDGTPAVGSKTSGE